MIGAASPHSLLVAMFASIQRLAPPAFLSAAVACGGSSSSDIPPAPAADAEATEAAPTIPSRCDRVADEICARAEACAGNGTAPVALSPGGAIVYESRAYCAEVFEEQCGADVPASYVPRVADPGACAAELATAVCFDQAIRLGPACGGTSGPAHPISQ
jgi:hypothetical protein